ncbi:MAG TPA: hypothetical protein VK643_09150 [Burkholderiales bacterium]|nr:hypothetical protein [Burkholderiales bacterium]
MKKLLASAALLAAALVPLTVTAHDDTPFDRRPDDSLTLAVFGDWPYNPILLDSAHLLPAPNKRPGDFPGLLSSGRRCG